VSPSAFTAINGRRCYLSARRYVAPLLMPPAFFGCGSLVASAVPYALPAVFASFTAALQYLRKYRLTRQRRGRRGHLPQAKSAIHSRLVPPVLNNPACGRRVHDNGHHDIVPRPCADTSAREVECVCKKQTQGGGGAALVRVI